MKTLLNPAIEATVRRMFGVDQYADVFEKLALGRMAGPLARYLLRRRLADDIATAPLLFIHVPKNGGTSVKRALYSSDPGHASFRYYAMFLPDQLARQKTLAVLRDPVERFLSGFDFLLAGGGGDVRIRPEPMRRMAGIDSISGLLDFLEASGGDWLGVDTFLRPQWWYVTDVHGRIGVEHLWLIEEAAAMRQFLAAFGIGHLRHSNRTRRRNHGLDASQRARVERLYAADFALYRHVQDAGGYTNALAGLQLSALSAASTSASIAS